MFNLLSLPNWFLKVSTKYAVILRIVIQIAVGPKTSSEKLLIEKAKKLFFFPLSILWCKEWVYKFKYED